MYVGYKFIVQSILHRTIKSLFTTQKIHSSVDLDEQKKIKAIKTYLTNIPNTILR